MQFEKQTQNRLQQLESDVNMFKTLIDTQQQLILTMADKLYELEGKIYGTENQDYNT